MVPVLTELMDPQHMKSVKNVRNKYTCIKNMYMYMYYKNRFLGKSQIFQSQKILWYYFCVVQYLDDLATVGKDEVHLTAPYREG